MVVGVEWESGAGGIWESAGTRVVEQTWLDVV